MAIGPLCRKSIYLHNNGSACMHGTYVAFHSVLKELLAEMLVTYFAHNRVHMSPFDIEMLPGYWGTSRKLSQSSTASEALLHDVVDTKRKLAAGQPAGCVQDMHHSQNL